LKPGAGSRYEKAEEIANRKKEVRLILVRKWFTAKETIGILYLEDTPTLLHFRTAGGRAEGPGNTVRKFTRLSTAFGRKEAQIFRIFTTYLGGVVF
jgi:hypothetical protein